MKKDAPKVETKPAVLREAMMRRVNRRLVASGSMLLPCAPGLLDAYADILSQQFRSVGRPFSTDEVAHLRKLLAGKLEEAYAASPFSRIQIAWNTDTPPAVTLSYTISIVPSSMEAEYEEWTRSRPPPLFGKHPDAKVLDVARSLGAPGEVAVLDVGAGTGRNTLPLARLGHTAAAVEASPALVTLLRQAIADESLPIEVFAGNVLDHGLAIPKGGYRLVILCEVLSHFRELTDVRLLFRRLGELLAPGGVLLFSAFVSNDAYTPEKLARELSQVFWSTVFTRRELAEAMLELPFEKVSDESVYAYEKEHLPSDAWPPTGWFAEWTRGEDVFAVPEGKSPMDLRWLAYRRV